MQNGEGVQAHVPTLGQFLVWRYTACGHQGGLQKSAQCLREIILGKFQLRVRCSH